jgi:hypothetical protein
MVSFNRLRALKDYSAMSENQEAGNSRWSRNKILGKVAATAALTGISLGLFAADTNSRIENTAAPEIAQTIDGMQEFVQLEGEDRYKLLVDTRPEVVVPQNFAPNFEAKQLTDPEYINLTRQLENEAEFLRANEDATTTLSVQGFASDESGIDSVNGDGNIGKPSENNRKLAEQRRDIAYEQSLEFMREFGDRVSVVKASAREVLFTEQDVTWLSKVAGIRGMSSEQFLRAYQNDRAALDLNTDESGVLFDLIDKNRGAGIVSERNITGINPASDAVILRQVAPTEDSKAKPETSNGNALKLLPVAGAVIAAAGLAMFARRRMKAKGHPVSEQVHEEIIPVDTSVEAPSQYSEAVDPLAKKIDWVMDRSRFYNSLKLDNYFYVGKHRKISKRKVKIGAAVASVAAIAGLAKPSWSTVVEPVIPMSKEPVYPLDESTLSYVKKSIFQFRFGRRFVYDEQPAQNPHRNHEQVSRPNVFTFDINGDLIQ